MKRKDTNQQCSFGKYFNCFQKVFIAYIEKIANVKNKFNLEQFEDNFQFEIQNKCIQVKSMYYYYCVCII